MDLTRDVPRSPYASLGGIVFLPRAIDKARADAADALGEYMSRRGFSVDLFEFLGVDVDGFHAAVAANASDADVLAWVEANMAKRSPDEIASWNAMMMTRTPPTPEMEAWYREFLADIGQGHRTDLTRHFDRLDLDEGRDVPLGGRR